MGATSNLRAKGAEKNWSIAELSHFVLCVFRYFRQFAIEKKFPSFQFFTPPPTFSRRHLPLPVNGVDAPGGSTVYGRRLVGVKEQNAPEDNDHFAL